MASLVHRIVQKATASPSKLSKEQKESVGYLLDEFKVELVIIGVDVIAARVAMGLAPADPNAAPKPNPAPLPLPQDTVKTVETLKKAFDKLDADAKKHSLTGYAQFRFDAYEPGGQALFPAASATGGPGPGSAQYGFMARRVRLIYNGHVGAKTDYRVQFDLPSHSAMNLRDIFAEIKDLPAKNLTLKVGQFVPPFGAELTSSSRTRESPERALAFTDSRFATTLFKGQVPIFNNQDRDVGLSLTWNLPHSTKVAWGLFDGEGRDPTGRRNQNRAIDTVFRASTTALRNHLEVGASLYYGQLALADAPGSANMVNAYRFLGGWDMKYTAPWGTQFRTEYLYGKFEGMPDRATYAKGNHVSGFMLLASHPVNSRFKLVAQYDEFNPTLGNLTLGGVNLNRDALNRQLLHFGALYRLDEGTRLRLWYTRSLSPYDPSALAGPQRDRLSYFITELQLDF
jgi:hypothetical protein